MSDKVIIHTDGACSGNPGPGGWGAILEYGGHTRELKGGEALTTNNKMELTAAMTWVGGSIIVHGLHEFGFGWPEQLVEIAAHWAEHTLPAIAGIAGWLATAAVDFVFGLALGALMIPVAGYAIAPALKAVKGLLPKRA